MACLPRPQIVETCKTVIRKGRSGPVRVELINYCGDEYRRYPDSRHMHLRRYYQRTHSDHRETFLHRQVWKDATGQKIPAGFDVHHRDHNFDNNQPGNLGAVPDAIHASHHATEYATNPANREQVLARMALMQPLATEWHKSRAGRAWHREHARWCHATRTPRSCVCRHCGKSFEGWHQDNQYCSSACYQRRRRALGIGLIEKVCQRCQTPFKTSRYEPGRTCSRRCTALASRHQEKST
jgi:hypothetical protein